MGVSCSSSPSPLPPPRPARGAVVGVWSVAPAGPATATKLPAPAPPAGPAKAGTEGGRDAAAGECTVGDGDVVLALLAAEKLLEKGMDTTGDPEIEEAADGREVRRDGTGWTRWLFIALYICFALRPGVEKYSDESESPSSLASCTTASAAPPCSLSIPTPCSPPKEAVEEAGMEEGGRACERGRA